MDCSIQHLLGRLERSSVRIPRELLNCLDYPRTDEQTLQVINWIRFTINHIGRNLNDEELIEIDTALSHATYIVGSVVSVADFAMLTLLKFDSRVMNMLDRTISVNDHSKKSNFDNIYRYYAHLTNLEALTHLRQKLDSFVGLKPEVTTSKQQPPSGKDLRFEEGGKFEELAGAKTGEVIVRFPPEASGYLHIGHAKAALINQHYRDLFQGQLILRFDDTNPAKEKETFEDSILADLPRLGVKWDKRTHTSDYFDLMAELCERMIVEGNAYVDNTDMEQMRIQRESRTPSVCRDAPIERNLAWWKEMVSGTDFGLQCCVRAKIDMNSNNGAMRDPTIYRCKLESHVRTGSKYKVYPLYDFACPIVDSVEGVTHALRTSEYNDRNEQYAWICEKLGLRCPIVQDYSRLALQHTVLSKRKLTWFVEEGLVDGWDDPRMPTVSGILRRGLTSEGLRQFILAQGSSRSSALMEWDKIWAFNKKVIDPVAPRHIGLFMSGPSPGLVPVHVEGQADYETKMVPAHPKCENLGTRPMLIGPHVLVEHADADCFVEGENVTFMNWGNLRITKITRDGERISRIDACLNLKDTDYKKTFKTTWLTDPSGFSNTAADHSLTPCACITYDHLLSKANIGKEEDFKQFINKNSKSEECVLCDPHVKRLEVGNIIQLQRHGYYICDMPYEECSPATGHESPCVLIRIPEGTTKTESVQSASAKMGSSSSSSSVNKKNAPQENQTPEQLAKALERQRKKEEKKEQRKEGRSKAKERMNQQTDASVIATASPDTAAVPNSTNANDVKKVKGKNSTVATRIENGVIDGNASKVTKSGPKTQATKKPATGGDSGQTKKQTKLAIDARKEDNFSDWYSQLITKAELMDYYDISGCYIIRPWAYSMWQMVQQFLDDRLRLLGVENAYFPMFVSKASLELEKCHVTDFAPEVAWVTKSGETTLAEPIAIRPTSETIMYPAFSRWIQSYRDLPLKLNQWSNVVRWEFKHPQPFLRTREFLWQEGHTAFAKQADAEEEVIAILNLYAEVYEDLFAIPVIKGRKTEREKFAGADYTTTVEIFIDGSGRAIQGATSHHLGQNFSRMFEITYDDPVTGSHEFAYQNSWGLTTRTLGVLFMVHSDNKGLVLPPRIAPYQIVIVPCGITAKLSEEDRERIISAAHRITSLLKSGYYKETRLRVHCDDRTNISPGWKFNHWELKGVPVRIEMGPEEVKNEEACLILRHNSEKVRIPFSNLCARMPSILDSVHENLFLSASKDLRSHVSLVDGIPSLCAALDAKSLAIAPFCGDSNCEELIRHESARNVVVEPGAPAMGAKSLCIPFSCNFNPDLPCGAVPTGTKCFNQPHCNRMAMNYTLFGRSY